MEGQRLDLLAGIAEHGGEGGIGLEDAPVEADDGDTDRRILHGAAEPLLALGDLAAIPGNPAGRKQKRAEAMATDICRQSFRTSARTSSRDSRIDAAAARKLTASTADVARLSGFEPIKSRHVTIRAAPCAIASSARDWPIDFKERLRQAVPATG